MLANGDRRDCFVVIDQAGGQHALNKKLTGLTLAATRERLADLDRQQLPSVEQAQAMQRARQAEREHPQPDRGRYDKLRETERDVQREQFKGRYDDLRAAEPPPEVVREFASERQPRDRNRRAELRPRSGQRGMGGEARRGRYQCRGPEGPPAARAGRREGNARGRAGAVRRRPQPPRAGGYAPARQDRRRHPHGMDVEPHHRGSERGAGGARDHSLPKSAPKKHGRANARRPSPRKPATSPACWREGEIVAVNAHGDVHRLDQRTTGDLRPEIEARLDGLPASIAPAC